MSSREQSIQLVSTDCHNKFILAPAAKQLLYSLAHPLAIVSIAGMYRTGKSYLVNRLLRNKANGFKTGNSTQAVTKGLHLWNKPILVQNEQGQQMLYLVIDSQGIGSCQQDLKYDLKLLMLVFLISSTVVYNSMGAIDELTLDQLRVVLNLKHSLSSQTFNQKSKLVWVLRDFALQLIDKNGHEITANEYLQQCLEQAPGSSLQARKKNEIRQAIKQGLGRRSCYTLVRPTMCEQDLADLSKCKIRSQFISQIQAVREQVFSGSSADIKRISGCQLTGRLLVGLLEQCMHVLNSGQMPQIENIWQGVRQSAYEQTYGVLSESLQAQIKRIVLPMGGQQLKLKLNQLQNKYYNTISQQFQDVQSFKKYHKMFLRQTQKINKQIRKRNGELNTQRTMAQIRSFVKENIHYNNVQPTNLTAVKVLIDRLGLKIKGVPEGYQYVLSVLFDIMHVAEQKAVYTQREVAQQHKMLEMGSLMKKNTDMTMISLKQDYSQALKTISNLKITQEECEKQLALSQHQNEIIRMALKQQQQDTDIKQTAHTRQIEEIHQRAKLRNDELAVTLKRVRQENSELVAAFEDIKQAQLIEGLTHKKEVILEEKMKEMWTKMEQEREEFRTQSQKMRRQCEAYKNKWQQEKRSRERQVQASAKDREVFGMKEKEYGQQLSQLKALHLQTKKTYAATFNAYKDSDRMLKNIENVSRSSVKLGSCKKTKNEQDSQPIRRYYQQVIEKLSRQHSHQLNQMKQQIKQIGAELQQERAKRVLHENAYRLCLQEKERLEKELMASTQRFADTVSEIEMVKEKERSLYEESIVRLLNNMDRRDSVLGLRK